MSNFITNKDKIVKSNTFIQAPAKPIKSKIKIINQLFDKGHIIKVFTSRYMGKHNGNVNLIKKYLSDVKPLSITTGNFLVMLVPALLILYFTDLQAKIALPTFSAALFFVLILGIVGTGFANIIFYKLIFLVD
jgi:hypothetical protein